MAKDKKTNLKPAGVFVVITTILLLATIGSLSFISFSRLNVSCQVTIDKSESLITNRQHKQAYDLLLSDRKVCGRAVSNSDSSEEKMLRLRFHHHLAVSAYVLNDKTLASAEAEKGVAVSKRFTAEKQKTRAQVNKLVTDMMFVKEDLY